jgi:hypothetical protein
MTSHAPEHNSPVTQKRVKNRFLFSDQSAFEQDYRLELARGLLVCVIHRGIQGIQVNCCICVPGLEVRFMVLFRMFHSLHYHVIGEL